MRIGIVTFHRSYNYGAVLQAYGLRKYLQSLGHNVQIVDYWPDYHENMYVLFSRRNFDKKTILGKIRYTMAYLFGLKRNMERRKGFHKFIQNSLNMPSTVTYRTKESIDGNFDILVYGSDQIWRRYDTVDFKGYDDVYFGEIPKLEKIAKITYAASMGVIYKENSDVEFVASKMKNFSSLLVRELDLQQYLSDIGIPSTLVLDPVFLLNKDSWFNLIGPLNNVDKKFLFYYEVLESKEALQLAKKICEEKNLDLIRIRRSVYPLDFDPNHKQTADPFYFLRLIRDAEFIVTTSFHGTAFSLIFEKQFLAVGLGKNSGRVVSLLQRLNLDQRYISGADLSKQTVEPIDYTIVSKNLNTLILDGQLELKKALDSYGDV